MSVRSHRTVVGSRLPVLCGSLSLAALAASLSAQPPAPVTRPPTAAPKAARMVQLPVPDAGTPSVARRRVRPGAAPIREPHAARKTVRRTATTSRTARAAAISASRPAPVRPSAAHRAERDSARRVPCAASWPAGTALLVPIALVTSEVRIPVAKRGPPPLTPCRVPVHTAATAPALPMIVPPPTMIGGRQGRGGMWWWLLGGAALGGGLLGSGVTSDDATSLPDALAEVPVSLPPAMPPRTVPTAPASPEGSGTSSGTVGAPAPTAPVDAPVDAPLPSPLDGTPPVRTVPGESTPPPTLGAPTGGELPVGAIPGVTVPGTTTPGGTPTTPMVTPHDPPRVPTVAAPPDGVPAATTAPEPSTGVLLGSALLLGGAWLRRRRSTHGVA